jgi:hypothetical protein
VRRRQTRSVGRRSRRHERATDLTGQSRDSWSVGVTARFDLPIQAVDPHAERDLDANLVAAAEFHRDGVRTARWPVVVVP